MHQKFLFFEIRTQVVAQLTGGQREHFIYLRPHTWPVNESQHGCDIISVRNVPSLHVIAVLLMLLQCRWILNNHTLFDHATAFSVQRYLVLIQSYCNTQTILETLCFSTGISVTGVTSFCHFMHPSKTLHASQIWPYSFTRPLVTKPVWLDFIFYS